MKESGLVTCAGSVFRMRWLDSDPRLQLLTIHISSGEVLLNQTRRVGWQQLATNCETDYLDS